MWAYMPQVEGREASVHIARFPSRGDLVQGEVSHLLRHWQELLLTREEVLKTLEAARTRKEIGKALEARIVLHLQVEQAHAFEKHSHDLPEIFGVSQVALETVEHGVADPQFEVQFARARGQRCDRCWRYTDDVGSDERYPSVCARCGNALNQIGLPPYGGEQEQAA